MINTDVGALCNPDAEHYKDVLPHRAEENELSHVLDVLHPLRVLHCIGSLGGGGAERQLSYLSRELSGMGIDVHVAYLRGGHNLKGLRESGATLHELQGRNNYDPGLLWSLIRLVRRVKPDLIQTWLPQMDILGGLVAVLTRTPFVMTERSCALAYSGGWKDHLRTWIGGWAAFVVSNSLSGEGYWLSRKHPAHVKVIPNGIPVQDIQGAPPMDCETQGFAKPKEILLYAGRYSPEKNLSTLLDAIFLVLSERIDAVALFFGEGPLKAELTSQVKSHGMEERVKISDYTAELWSLMKLASVFVSVSVFEGSPNTVLEAAVQRCPLVLSDVPQHRELLGDDGAFFVSPSVAPEIASGILEALHDPGKARRKAQCAYHRISRLTLDSTAGEYLDLYRNILAPKDATETLQTAQTKNEN
jgi:glycosyltransferase involved in cell wall biosynthesis